METRSKTGTNWPNLSCFQSAGLRRRVKQRVFTLNLKKKIEDRTQSQLLSKKNIRHVSTDGNEPWELGDSSVQIYFLHPVSPHFLCYLGFKSNTQNQSGLCVLNLNLVLEAMGSYENILFGENEMISFIENGLGGSKTGKTEPLSGCPTQNKGIHSLWVKQWGTCGLKTGNC